jgi:hypothetical protein
VKCRPPVGASASAAVEVVASGIPSTDAGKPPSVFVRYSAPAVYHASPSTWNTTGGGGQLAIHGRDFGVPLPVTVWLHRGVLPNDAALLGSVRGVLVCPVNSSGSSATLILCAMPAGYDSNWVVTVINHADAAASFALAQVAARAMVRVGYASPVLASAAVVRSAVVGGQDAFVDAAGVEGAAPAVGGFLIRLRGINLSTRPTVLLSGDECPLAGDVSPSHDSVVCTAPPRRINTAAVVVVTSGSLVSNAVPFSFDAPLLTSVEPPLITAMAHTQPATVRVSGANFGVVLPLVASSHRVAIGGRHCLTVSWLSDATLTCLFAEELPVGLHNVTVWVRDDVSRASSVSVRAECPPSFYGADGSLCAACPDGGKCDGGMSDPVAIRGFYRVSRAAFVQCQPREACLGGVNSTCHRNYGGDRCADCVVGTYRCVLRVVQRGYLFQRHISNCFVVVALCVACSAGFVASVRHAQTPRGCCSWDSSS